MDELLKSLSGYGALGICLGLSLYFNIILVKRNDRLQDKLTATGEKAISVIEQNTVSQNNNTEATRALGVLIKTQDSATADLLKQLLSGKEKA